jgi:hypothetical protein
MGLRTLPPNDRVSFTGKSHKTTTGHAPLEKARASLVCLVTAVAFRSPRHPFLGPVQINSAEDPESSPNGNGSLHVSIL